MTVLSFVGLGRGKLDGQLSYPRGLCLMSDGRHVAVADTENGRVSIFSVDGEFIRHVGVGVLRGPRSIACSTVDELVVVADSDNSRVAVFSASRDLIATSPVDRACVGVVVYGSTMFALSGRSQCVVFTWSTW